MSEEKLRNLKDVTKVRWAVQNGCIVTEEKFRVPDTKFAIADHKSVAFNVGERVAQRIVDLHNAKLEAEWAQEKARQ